jgi:ankyrin repeat protein
MQVGASLRESDKYGNTIVHYAALNGQVCGDTNTLQSQARCIPQRTQHHVKSKPPHQPHEAPGLPHCFPAHVYTWTLLFTAFHLRIQANKRVTHMCHAQTRMLSLVLAIDEGHIPDHSAGATGGGPTAAATCRLAEVRNEAGLTPLHFAVWGGSLATLSALAEHRPDLVGRSIADSMAQVCLFVCVCLGGGMWVLGMRGACLHTFLQVNAVMLRRLNPNDCIPSQWSRCFLLTQVTCNGGSTPLHVAALRNDPAMVNALLDMYIKASQSL